MNELIATSRDAMYRVIIQYVILQILSGCGVGEVCAEVGADGWRQRGDGVESESAGDEYVVVVSRTGAERAVGLHFIQCELVARFGVAFHKRPVAQSGDQSVDNHRL